MHMVNRVVAVLSFLRSNYYEELDVLPIALTRFLDEGYTQLFEIKTDALKEKTTLHFTLKGETEKNH